MLLGSIGITALLAFSVMAQPQVRPGYQRDPTDIVSPYGRARIIRSWEGCEADGGYDCWTDGKVYYRYGSQRRPYYYYEKASRVSRGTRNGPAAYAGQAKSILSNWIGTGWVLVPFGDTGVPAPKALSIKSNRRVRVDAVDLYCTGDRFRLEATEVNGDLVYELITSRRKADGCQLRTADPQQAWDEGDWSQGTLKLPPGHYTLKVFVESSPYGGGTMAVRARYF